ncbi:MAG: DUF2493 domain-containing protein, partial [Alphaproteobacteria bacterium]|nr:DUF2493 domain-containing protein [Alphaproteobacteria bacterium]
MSEITPPTPHTSSASTLSVQDERLQREIQDEFNTLTTGGTDRQGALTEEMQSLNKQGLLEKHGLSNTDSTAVEKDAFDRSELVGTFQDTIADLISATRGTSYEGLGERYAGYIVKSAMVQAMAADHADKTIRHQLDGLAETMNKAYDKQHLSEVDSKIGTTLERLSENQERADLLTEVYHAARHSYEEATGKSWERSAFGAGKGQEPGRSTFDQALRDTPEKSPASPSGEGQKEDKTHTPRPNLDQQPTHQGDQQAPQGILNSIKGFFHGISYNSMQTSAQADMKGAAWKMVDNINFQANSNTHNEHASTKQQTLALAKQQYKEHFGALYERGQDINANTQTAAIKEVIKADRANDRTNLPDWQDKDRPRIVVGLGKQALAEPVLKHAITDVLDKVKNKYPDMIVVHNNYTYGADKITADWAKQTSTPQIKAELPTHEHNGNPINTDTPQGKGRQQYLRNEQVLALNPKAILTFDPTPMMNKLVQSANQQGVTTVSIPELREWNSIVQTKQAELAQTLAQEGTQQAGRPELPGLLDQYQQRAETHREKEHLYLKNNEELAKDQSLDVPDGKKLGAIGLLPQQLREASKQLTDNRDVAYLDRVAHNLTQRLGTVVENHRREEMQIDDYKKHLLKTNDGSDIQLESSLSLEMTATINQEKGEAIDAIERNLTPREQSGKNLSHGASPAQLIAQAMRVIDKETHNSTMEREGNQLMQGLLNATSPKSLQKTSLLMQKEMAETHISGQKMLADRNPEMSTKEQVDSPSSAQQRDFGKDGAKPLDSFSKNPNYRHVTA